MDNKNLYSQELMHYYKNPVHKGKIDNKSLTSKESNLSCGDSLNIDLLVEANVVKDAKFNGVGCIVSLASAEILCEHIISKKIEDLKNFDQASFLSLIGFELSPSRQKCALIGYKAFSNAIKKV